MSLDVLPHRQNLKQSVILQSRQAMLTVDLAYCGPHKPDLILMMSDMLRAIDPQHPQEPHPWPPLKIFLLRMPQAVSSGAERQTVLGMIPTGVMSPRRKTSPFPKCLLQREVIKRVVTSQIAPMMTLDAKAHTPTIVENVASRVFLSCTGAQTVSTNTSPPPEEEFATRFISNALQTI